MEFNINKIESITNILKNINDSYKLLLIEGYIKALQKREGAING